MKKLMNDLEELLTVAVIVTVAAAFIFLTLGCTSQSQRRFEPTRKVNVEREQHRQALAGKRGPYSGMDCLELIRAQMAYCDSNSCTWHQLRDLRKAERRLNKHYRSQCVYDSGHIRDTFRRLRGRGL